MTLPTKKKQQAKRDGPRFVAQNRYVWMDYTDPDQPDAPPFRVYVRADLTFGESNTLVITNETPMTEAWDIMAPFVKDWNLDLPDGEPVPPPAEAGGKQFDYLPNGIFWKMWGDLKFRSSGTLESKRSTEFASAAVIAADANSANP